MNESWNFTHCVSVLTGEIELLKKISAAQDRVRQLVMNREWADFDEKLMEVNRMVEEFSHLEDERVRLFASLSNTPEAAEEKTFNAIISHLSMDESREFSRLHRELKMETLKMRALNESFLTYLNEARIMAAA